MKNNLLNIIAIIFITNTALAGSDLIFKNGMEANEANSELAILAASMVSGEWAELKTIGFGDDAAILRTDGGGHILEYNNELSWDPIGRQLFVIGTSRGTIPPLYGPELNQKWVQYSEETNTWTALPNPEYYIGQHSYDHAALNITNGDYYVRKAWSRQVWRYRNSDWARVADIPMVFKKCCNSLEYFPEMDSIIFIGGRLSGNTEIFRYNETSDSWSQLASGVHMPMGNFHDFIEYSSVHGLLLFGGGKDPDGIDGSRPELYSMDGDGNIAQRTDAPFTYNLSGTLTVTEPTSGNLLVFRRRNNSEIDTFHEYVVSSDTWQTHAADPALSLWGASARGVVAGAIPEYGVVMFLRIGFSGSAVILYKH